MLPYLQGPARRPFDGARKLFRTYLIIQLFNPKGQVCQYENHVYLLLRVSQGLEHAYKGTRVTLRGTNTLAPPIHR